MKERWATCALGAWLMGSVIMITVATKNFRVVDELLQGSENASFRLLIQQWGPAPTRELLRYLSSELNREYFQLWNVAQAALGALAFWLIKGEPAQRQARALIVGAWLVVIAMLVSMTPMITSIGRSLDFVPRDPPPPALARFWILHVAYTVLELAKLGALALAAFWIARGRGPGRVTPGGSALAPVARQ